MPPKRSLFADSNQILLGIHHGNIAWIAELTAAIDAAHLRHDYHTGVERAQLGDARDGWVGYSLELFSGRTDLSESHKQIWRREVRQLEADGLVERSVRLIRLTQTGMDRVQRLLDLDASREAVADGLIR